MDDIFSFYCMSQTRVANVDAGISKYLRHSEAVSSKHYNFGAIEDSAQTSRVMRSSYVGRGNVQAVHEARKRASLSDMCPRDDPLLSEFAAFLRASGAAANDVNNKTGQTSKLVHYLSTRYSLQSKVN